MSRRSPAPSPRTNARLWVAAAAVAACAAPSLAVFNLVVPAGNPAAINATVDDDGNIVFPAREWQPINTFNAPAGDGDGVTVTFEATPFIHATKNALRRDCRLNLAVVSQPFGWSIVTANDQTNYQGGDNTARVVARSVWYDLGAVRYNLTATFITGEYDQLAEGSYNAVVTVTMVGNP